MYSSPIAKLTDFPIAQKSNSAQHQKKKWMEQSYI